MLQMIPCCPWPHLEGAWQGEGKKSCHKAGGIRTWIDGWGSRMAPSVLHCTVHHQMAAKRERERERERDDKAQAISPRHATLENA